MRIALFHPTIVSKGGSERVILEFIKHTQHNVDLYTWVYKPQKTYEEFKNFKIHVINTPINKLLKSRSFFLRLVSLFLLPFFTKIPLEKYDVFIISAGHIEFITFTNYKPKKTIAYIHTPLRAASKNLVKWNLKYRYKNLLMKLVYLIGIRLYRKLEKNAWKKIDVAIFNSELTLQRAKERNLIKNKKIYVVYPPISLEKIKTRKPENYFLYASRFSIYKRQDVLIDAWAKFVKEYPEYKLILAGFPSDNFEIIKEKAKKTKNIKIETNIDDERLKELYSKALACFFLGFEEDFGIAPFEVLSAGKTLMAVDKGGYVDLIKKAPSVIWVKERYDAEKVAEEVYKALKKFIKNKDYYIRKGLKNKDFIKSINLSPKEFTRKIDELIFNAGKENGNKYNKRN
ncbi:MAG: glycosyltransferase [Candidatus Aenigmatarchaeota archaeon]